MSNGYFISKGDSTTCGGKVLEGDSGINMFGLFHAREFAFDAAGGAVGGGVGEVIYESTK